MIKIKLSDLLGKHKMTQRALTMKTGIRPGTVSKLYHETTQRLEVDHLNEICKTLDCQPGDLLEYIPDEAPDSH
ncbi:Cro/C1-type HTH DNA-binding domain protein [Acididesulfobacillus acetoxydans]|uniref:Cro/C1-type HTH DNA-binding domain protein n=1 Tax=Acididesulfobacillus acetoxydans TaxID=1561005 RepID=A0A8S0Y3V2_9FIRM|nr:helix-turn-helix transcriptional regulator [Acididesulfobacillus acetoxydans]CAA7602445.1 Cro/C1-type HTH DNA-binding domain protein [Acididesulfobacillus acetoxydans]CEJ05900.1 Cro/C1-type HTH domain profile [Acididesulfobacillus acetoxydans]